MTVTGGRRPPPKGSTPVPAKAGLVAIAIDGDDGVGASLAVAAG